MVRKSRIIAAFIVLAGTSTAFAQEDAVPVRQNVYPAQAATYPVYPPVYGGYPQTYPGYPPVGYPGYPGSGYPTQYPGYPPYGLPPGYPVPNQTQIQPQGSAGQNVIRDPATGQVLGASGGPGSNTLVDPSVFMRGQTPTRNGPQPPPGSGLGGQGPARFKLVEKSGRTAGIRDGYASEAQRINAALGKIAGWLDRKYDFSALMINDHIVPPVVILTNNRVEKNGPQILELTLGRFEITEAARLTAQAPSWRTYLFLQSDPSNGVDLRPRTKEDEAAWDSGYALGMAAGVAEARSYFEEAERRMRRDFEGMVRYHDLANRGAIRMPVSSSKTEALRISRDGQVALRGRQSIKIVVEPAFKNAGPGAFPVGASDVTMRNVATNAPKAK